MSSYPTFPNAPITEAVLDIKVGLSVNFEIKTLLDVYEQPIKDRFSNQETLKFLQAGVTLSRSAEPEALPTKRGIRGYIFSSQDRKKLFQSRIDGFTLNKLKPYENWASFSSEGKELWDIYREKIKPEKVIGISLRYINRIEVPMPLKDFNVYIKTNPHIAEGLPQSVSHFFMRLVIPKDDIGANSIVTQTMDRLTKDGKLPLILDIQVDINKEYSVEKTIWNDFELLRDFKNDIFFKSLTDKAKELFK